MLSSHRSRKQSKWIVHIAISKGMDSFPHTPLPPLHHHGIHYHLRVPQQWIDPLTSELWSG